VQERAHVVRFFRLHDVEGVVRESILDRGLDRLAPSGVQRAVLRELLVNVLEDVLPLCRARGGSEQERYE